jgi:hypothetical protein
MAYVKLDTAVLDSTLWVERECREVFITALLLAEPFEVMEPLPQIAVRTLDLTGFEVPPGWYGFIHAAGSGILRRALVENEAGMAALERLGAPDHESRSPEYDGRRLVRVNGGFIVLNFFKYRDRDHTAATRSKRYRDRQKKLTATRDDVTPHRDDTLRDSSVTEAVSSKQEAEALTALHDARFSEEAHRTAYQQVRMRARNREAFDAMLATLVVPISGGPAYSWLTVGQAMLEMQATGAAPSAAAIRAYCRRLKEPATTGLGRKGGATGDGIDWTQHIPEEGEV